MAYPRIPQVFPLRAVSALVLLIVVAASVAQCTTRPDPGRTAAASPTAATAARAAQALSPVGATPGAGATATASAAATGPPGSPAGLAATATPPPPTAAPATPTAPPEAHPVLPAGILDPTNGPLRHNRLVTFYGHPFSDKMGVLGEYQPDEMVRRLKEQADLYTKADPTRPAIPTIELIASVAQASPGPDGLFLQRTPPAIIEQYAQLAEKNNMLLLLDIQIGRGTVAADIRAIEPYLKRPYVHLAIDPEFAVKPGQVPGDEFGSIDASDIIGAARTLADVVTQNGITDKVLLVHQFVPSMITNKQLLKPMPHVEIVLNVDGFGSAKVKKDDYRLLVTDEPIQYGGMKLFYKQDDPLMAPEEVLALTPSPVVVIFQ
ncbi:MAG TPA: hypothetical protein VFW96_08895 [Thermomicrobiales bacterium]|nr:hypothetical protein [Thermomicrobiales bacterium]